MATVSAQVTKFFFDRVEVMRAVDKSRLRILGRAGGKVRQSAKRLLVYKPLPKKPRPVRNRELSRQRMAVYQAAKKAATSRPGQVPFVHRKQYPSLSSVVYAYDPASKSVVVGPIERRNRTTDRPAPDTHEHAGSVRIAVRASDGTQKRILARYPARPIMGPAFQAVAAQIPEAMANAIGPS